MNARPPTEVLFAAHEDAAAFYRRQLMSSLTCPGPRRYLASRGFGELLQPETVWTVGYAPAAWTATYDHLRHLGYCDNVLETAGLVIRTRRNTLVDRFRDRITFGIRDMEGRLCGFTARRAPGASTACPKYLNSPATPIYDKRQLLFGLGEGQHRDRHAGTTVLVEGPLDAICIAMGTAVTPTPYVSLALCGSQLTTTQASIVCSRSAKAVLLALDSDEAGRLALYRAYKILAPLHVTLCVTRSSSGDPADVLATHGSDAVQRLVETAVPALDAVIDDLIGTWPARGMGAEADLCCLRSAAAWLVGIKAVDIAATARRLTDNLDLGLSTVTRELVDAVSPRSTGCCTNLLVDPQLRPRNAVRRRT